MRPKTVGQGSFGEGERVKTGELSITKTKGREMKETYKTIDYEWLIYN